MPTYEYVCTECMEKMEVQASVSEKVKGLKLICPKCGSKKMAQVFSGFSVLGSSRGGTGGPICGPQRGPGCCG
ncbi:MAG: FmdB family zinc ribbon protein [Thermodesulfobacteriota bacterium]